MSRSIGEPPLQVYDLVITSDETSSTSNASGVAASVTLKLYYVYYIIVYNIYTANSMEGPGCL